MTPSDVSPAKAPARWHRRSLVALPLLFLAVFAFAARIDITDYFASHELRVAAVKPGGAAPYARAEWSLVSARVVDTGGQAKLPLPADRRLVLIRLKAVPEGKLPPAANGESPWMGCSLTLLDDKGRRWSPLNFVLSRDISRALDPTASPVAGCFEAARSIGLDGQPTLVEEKFLIPADVTSDLSAQLSFRPSLPDALNFPLEHF